MIHYYMYNAHFYICIERQTPMIARMPKWTEKAICQFLVWKVILKQKLNRNIFYGLKEKVLKICYEL